MDPRVTDNDKGEITVTLDARELRGWAYKNDAERRQKAFDDFDPPDNDYGEPL